MMEPRSPQAEVAVKRLVRASHKAAKASWTSMWWLGWAMAAGVAVTRKALSRTAARKLVLRSMRRPLSGAAS
jgi:hypothetical protein